MSHMEQCKTAWELSYEHLPDNLKLCFIYFGAFPEDKEICAQKLIRLWMAEGFVSIQDDLLLKRIEDVAQEYLDNLIQRNLIMIVKTKSTRGVKTCRIHDLLHNFSLMKGKQENLFHLLLQRHDGLADFNEPCNLVRLSIHSDALHFKDSRLFCPLANSLLFFDNTKSAEDSRLYDVSFIIQTFKLLKVLHMDWIWFITEIPSEIAILTRLTYLSIGSRVPVIPSSIGYLSNLETLILRFLACEVVSLPNTIWDLQKLKYIHITGHCNFPGFSFPTENLKNNLNLLKLEAICGVIFYSALSMEKQMKKCPNIHKLKCHILCGGESSEKLNNIVVVPKYLSELEFLTLCAERELQYKLDFGLTAKNLRKVTLQRFVLSREEIVVIGNLPNLEVLKLLGIHFLGGIMEMKEGEFSKLRILVFRGSYERSNLETWTATGDDPLPCLEKLVFRSCTKLKEIPYSCLETSLTLGEIEIYRCSSALESLVRHIEEVQEDFANSIKVQIYSIPKGK